MAKYFIQVLANCVYEKEVEAKSEEEARHLAYDEIYDDGFDGFSLADETLTVYVDTMR